MNKFFWKEKETARLSQNVRSLCTYAPHFLRSLLGFFLLIWDTALQASGRGLHSCWLFSKCLNFITERIRTDLGSGNGKVELEPVSSEHTGGRPAQEMGELWTGEKILSQFRCWPSLAGPQTHLFLSRRRGPWFPWLGSMCAGVHMCARAWVGVRVCAGLCMHVHMYVCVWEREDAWISTFGY